MSQFGVKASQLGRDVFTLLATRLLHYSGIGNWGVENPRRWRPAGRHARTRRAHQRAASAVAGLWLAIGLFEVPFGERLDLFQRLCLADPVVAEFISTGMKIDIATEAASTKSLDRRVSAVLQRICTSPPGGRAETSVATA